MTLSQAILSRPFSLARRGTALRGFAVTIAAFLIVQGFIRFDVYTATALNDCVWWLCCLAAMLSCWYAARQLTGAERTAWQLLSLACGLWLAGQSVWTYYELVRGGLPKFPHWMQILFSAYDWVFVAGLLALPKPLESGRFTPRHGGNLALITCALLVAFIVALLEPALLPKRNLASGIVVLLHCTGLASMLLASLYLLWSYPWQALYWPLVLIVLGAATHTATYIAYAHQMMTQTYAANEWSNANWLFVFGAYACAAYERAWRQQHAPPEDRALLQQRERWLEALVPAMLIVAMLSMGWFYKDWFTTRVAALATLGALVFALVLGFREVWIHRQEQRLIATLNEAHENMVKANRDLTQSETRYRTLSAELERRVNERTVELQHAYRELENFSYAVAHDLKAPLRSVDGFGAMLAEEYGARLDDKGRGYLQRMRRSALKMSELIDDLLAYSRVERRNFELTTVSLPTLIEKVVAEQRDELERHDVQLDLRLQPVSAVADPDGLLLACRNLLQNAIKFSQTSRPPQIAIAIVADADGVTITVKDNGIGFDMDHHEKIFEMFQRLHRADEIPGTGIGLAIVRKAVERMGGHVWASSKLNEGATFHLRLPALPAGHAATADSAFSHR